MNLTTTLPTSSRLRAFLATRFALPLVLVLAGLVGVAGWLGWQAYQARQLPGTPASADVVEAQWGIRLTHIAVLADGGLIDFRFQVIDPDKAGPLFSLDNRPILIAEQTGEVVDSLYHPPHSHDIVAGQSQYFLYNNHRGAIQSGALVSVVLGDLRLEHVVVK